ncbi:hypothetical protein [Staphylococcus coagulans]|uniref:hypothetical protein n=1 Tax=Staphylococcus coagulans TaxID=74706 RepID=UPI0033652E8D
MSMTPFEWRDWIIGGKDRQLDMRELSVGIAEANGLVQAGKSLKRIVRDIEKQRYEIRDDLDSYYRKKDKELQERVRRRKLFQQGTEKFMKQFE